MQIYKQSLMPKGGFIVAVSGGVDSIVLAHVLAKKFDFMIFHYNHNVRPQNDVMEQTVRKFADDIDRPFVTFKRSASRAHLTSEAELREDRFAAYKRLGADIIQGHHLDDAVESYLMNCLKGEPSYKPIDEYGFIGSKRICRPMIVTPKKDIIGYADQNDLAQYIVQDETNEDERYFRNKVRSQIVEKFPERGLGTVVKKLFYSHL